MTNEEKFHTAEERVRAFGEFCKKQGTSCENCPYEETDEKFANCVIGFAHWLALEADEEKPEPCFYCGHEMHYRVEHRNFTDKHWLECTNGNCNFESPKYESKNDAIAAHNLVARAVRAAKESEVK